MINFSYSRPGTVKAAIAALAADASAQCIAGGTNLVDLMKRGVTTPRHVIDITGLPLRTISKKEGTLYIGALSGNREIAENPLVMDGWPLLSLAINAGASPQLRNMATLGGNILQRTRCTYFYDTAMPCNKRNPGSGCGALNGYNRMHAIFGTSDHCIAVHPSDMCVALAAMDTTIVVQGKKGERKIPFTDFHRLPGTSPEKDTALGPDELITGISVAPCRYGKKVQYLKIRDRSSFAFAIVSVAAALELDNDRIISARLAMGGVAHKPWRLYKAETYLQGKTVSADLFRTTAESIVADATSYKGNDFKLKLAPACVFRALQEAAAK